MIYVNLTLIALAGYVMGSIPSSIWLGKFCYKLDIRHHGSGNAGGTNVFRVLGWKPALVVVLVDVGKGLVPTLFFAQWRLAETSLDHAYFQLAAGLAAICGHVWTMFAGFRGGKGVATAAGMLLVLYPLALPICLLVFVVTVVTTRFVGLASILATVALPVSQLLLMLVAARPVSAPLLIISFLLVFFILFTHRANIGRMMAGTENKIELGPTKKTDPEVGKGG